jgi:hypothetical protein
MRYFVSDFMIQYSSRSLVTKLRAGRSSVCIPARARDFSIYGSLDSADGIATGYRNFFHCHGNTHYNTLDWFYLKKEGICLRNALHAADTTRVQPNSWLNLPD